MKKNRVVFAFAVVVAAVFMFTSASTSLDGRAVVADAGELPEGLFARTVGYLPGDSISVTNMITRKTIDILVIGALDASEGIAILLSEEAASELGIVKDTNTVVKITKRSDDLDKVYSGSAVLARGLGDGSNDIPPENTSASSASNALVPQDNYIEDDFSQNDMSQFDYDGLAAENGNNSNVYDNLPKEETAKLSERYFDDFKDANKDDNRVSEKYDEKIANLPPPDKEAVASEMLDNYNYTPTYKKQFETVDDKIPAEPKYTKPERFVDNYNDTPVYTKTVEAVDDEIPTEPKYSKSERFVDSYPEPEPEFLSSAPEYVDEADEKEITYPPVANSERVIIEYVPEKTTVPAQPKKEEVVADKFTEYREAEKIDDNFMPKHNENLPSLDKKESIADAPKQEKEQPVVTEKMPPKSEDAPAKNSLADSVAKNYTSGKIADDKSESNTPASENTKASDNTKANDDASYSYDPIVLVPAEPNPPASGAVPPKKDIIASAKNLTNATSTSETKNANTSVASNSYNDSGYNVSNMRSLESGKYYVQIAASDDSKAVKTVIARYGQNYPIVVVPTPSNSAMQIMVGPLSVDEYEAVIARFKSYGFDDAFLRKIN